jgi:hypothetical protein
MLAGVEPITTSRPAARRRTARTSRRGAGAALPVAVLLAAACGAVSAPDAASSAAVSTRPPDPADGFLVGLNPIHYTDSGPTDTDLEEARRMGAHAMRVWVHWREIEPARGEFRWGTLDRLVEGLEGRGIEPWFVVVGSPAHAVRTSRVPEAWDSLTFPDDLDAYRVFLGRLVARHRGRVRHYEIWNEPDHEYYAVGGGGASEYAALLAASYETIRSVDSAAQVIMAGTAGTNLPYVRDVLARLGGRRALDGLAAHPYRWSDATGFHTAAPGDRHTVAHPAGGDTWVDLREEILLYREALREHGYPDAAVWITEFGYPAHDDLGGPAYLTLTQQAEYLEATRRVLRDPEMRFVKGFFWFADRDWAEDPADTSAQQDFGFFGLARTDLSWKPAATVFRRWALDESSP